MRNIFAGGEMFLLFFIGIEKAAWSRQGGWRASNAHLFFLHFYRLIPPILFSIRNVARVENDSFQTIFLRGMPWKGRLANAVVGSRLGIGEKGRLYEERQRPLKGSVMQ